MKKIEQELKKIANPEKKKILQKFFKTAKGEYGEGDIFLGVTVPQIRKTAKEFENLNLQEIKKTLNNKHHEVRLTALLILVARYEQAKKKKNHEKTKKIVYFYLENLKKANNWDLIDLSSYKILGDYVLTEKKERKILYELARSKNLWERRAAIVSTLTLIKNNDLKDVYAISKKLIQDKEDLIHKATGWMLREAGKKDEEKLKKYLQQNIKQIPRTTLRYAIEKLPLNQRKEFLNLKNNYPFQKSQKN